MAKNYFDISSKVIVLTGANGLIGRNIGAALLDQGGYLVELDVNFTQALDIADLNKHLRVNCDIKDPVSIEKARDQILTDEISRAFRHVPIRRPPRDFDDTRRSRS